MELSRASDKSIRTTAMDSFGVLKIFLIQVFISSCPGSSNHPWNLQASSADITTLFDRMQERISRCQSLAPSDPANGENEKNETAENEEAPPSAKVAVLEEESWK